MIKKLICQAPTYLDDLHKVVSPHEMSTHEIENVKWVLLTKSLRNHIKYDSGVSNNNTLLVSMPLLTLYFVPT